jgi:predicted phosphoribosyltransferase
MMAAARTVRRQKPKEIVVAIPTASLDTIELLAKEVDKIICLNVRTGSYFAVAEAYRNWYDLSREEVVELLISHKFLKDEANSKSG